MSPGTEDDRREKPKKRTARNAVLESARVAWVRDIYKQERFLAVNIAFASSMVSLLVARGGTPGPRLAAGASIAFAVALSFTFLRFRWRAHRDERQILRRLFERIDRERAERAERALRLLSIDDGTSVGLRELHLERMFFALPLARLVERLTQRGRRLRFFATSLFVASGFFTLINGFRLFEGVDVLFARRGEAPIAAEWLEGLSLRARPPAYLKMNERTPTPYEAVSLPVGTVLTVRAQAKHPGRELFLTDGVTRQPFASDGAGGVVASWTLFASADLRVVARFGHVTIAEPRSLPVTAIEDEAPIIDLQDAPRTIDLTATKEHDIDLKFSVVDDHGLREVALVLRSGERTERRTIARLDGETKTHEAGIRFRLGDPFVQKSHLPVEITIEAKDNDPVTGPKWGKSSAIELRPPAIGEAERDRIFALRAARDAYVDALAALLSEPGREPGSEPVEVKKALERTQAAFDDARARLEEAIAFDRAGRRLPPRLRSVLRGRFAKYAALEKAWRAGREREKFVVGTEKLILYVDGVIRGQGYKEARKVALELADVAEQVLKPLADIGGAVPDPHLFDLLDGGGRALLTFGSLGHDLGELTVAYTKRIRRGLAEQDRVHAALAAADLMLRLRTPDPSFKAEGGGGGGGDSAGEGGSGEGGEGESSGEGDASEGDRAFEDGAHDLDDLVQKHSEAIDKAEQASNGEGTPEEKRERADEAKRHAENVRRGIESLKGSESEERVAREQGEDMAGALERRDLSEAVRRGKEAMKKLEGARDGKSEEARKRINDARGRLEEEVAWAEAENKRDEAGRGKGKGDKLREVGEEERRLAERAREFAESGEDERARSALREATKRAESASEALKKGDVREGLSSQREAQRQLEIAREALSSEQSSNGENGSSLANEKTKIPTGDEHKGPEEFRKRVLRGLANPHSPKYSDAVRRYAEELLR